MINYFSEGCPFILNGKRKYNSWITNAITEESKKPGQITVIFCSDEYILEVNKKYLNHDYFTDIITFGYGNGVMVSGDLFISIDTVKSNSEKFGVTFQNELSRVIIHGILHLCGYRDKTDEESAVMRLKEDYYISKLQTNNDI